MFMEALLTSTVVVALAEVGDKTQLLAIVLATRFKRPWPIIVGIFAATIANHFLVALCCAVMSSVLVVRWFRDVIACSFIAMAVWTLIPYELHYIKYKPPRFGAFLTTTIAFFLVEMGDKTQIATIALCSRFHEVVPVTMGTTVGMMLANVPAVFLGNELIRRVQLKTVRMIAALLFLFIGLWMLAKTAGLA